MTDKLVARHGNEAQGLLTPTRWLPPVIPSRYCEGTDFANRFEDIVLDEFDDVYRSLVTPEMTARLHPISRRGVDRLREDCACGPISAERIVRRVLTLMQFDDVSMEVALDAVASGIEKRGKSYGVVWDDVYKLLRETKEFRPSYGAEEYDRMAREMQRSTGGGIAITRGHMFVMDDALVSDKDMSAQIRRRLLQFDIWDAQRSRIVPVDARLVREVMNALRQTWCPAVDEPGGAKAEVKLIEGVAVAQSAMTTLCEEELEFGVDCRMPTADLEQRFLLRWGRAPTTGDYRELRRLASKYKGKIERFQLTADGVRGWWLRGVKSR